MSKVSDVVASIAEQVDSEIAAANKAIGGKDECSEDQIANIIATICAHRDHETDAAVREDVRAAVKAKPWVFKAEKPAK